MTRSEIIRVRRQMHQRIREVVAERRMARLTNPPHGGSADQGALVVESRSEHRETFLIGG